MTDDRPVHAPYAEGKTPFMIGLTPIDPSEWIEVDADLPRDLALKATHRAAEPGEVFLAEPDTLAAQAEALALLVAHLPARFPEIYAHEGAAMRVAGVGSVALDGPEPLWTAASLVQEDLVIMRSAPEGWRFVAGALAFPSSWAPSEKFGRPLDAIHAPVPGFSEGTRNAVSIARIFDRLGPEALLERHNWSVYGDDRLRHMPRGGAAGPRRGEKLATPHVRVERQTLRKLPASGDLLFTVRIHVDPFERLAAHPDRARLAGALADRLEGFDADQAAYKSLTDERAALVARLRAIAAS